MSILIVLAIIGVVIIYNQGVREHNQEKRADELHDLLSGALREEDEENHK